ncbi:BTB/POZ and MATH domain-containing protein 1-like [Phragmites australis]|uniref:BTB/POZ and MATH domain-containing protein 1-like n=1 Tax=Phragmites australis TaxID=29695 RepID=UPI002D782452|nr:BTB/POZ and MATH domain-containing protein 1-like [Phragmites australis]
MATSASSAGHPSRSATTIVSVREHHLVKIVGYSRTLNAHCGRPEFSSCPFRARGRTWCVSYRPQGSPGNDGNTDFISLYILLVDIVDEPLMAKATFSLPFYIHITDTNNFSVNRAFGCERFVKREDLERSEHLKDDCFSIKVRIHIVKEAPSIMVPPSDMQQHLGNLLLTKELADVEFRVGEETFPAHRIVLGARSPVFKAQLYGPMKEGTTSNIIRIDDMEAQVFRALLTFIYTDTWPEMEQEDESAMTQHLLATADRYCLQRLKLMCEHRLYKHIDKSSVAIILALAEKHHCCGLKEACFEFLGSSTTLLAVVETEEFEYLARSCPAIMKELIRKAINIANICDNPPSS